MKRKLATILFPENEAMGHAPGDEASHRAASSLGDRFDGPTIQAISDTVAFLERIGGQAHIVTLREPFNSRGERCAEDDPDAQWTTVGLTIEYETRDARVALAKPPKSVAGVPISGFEDPAFHVEIEPPPQVDAAQAGETPEAEDERPEPAAAE